MTFYVAHQEGERLMKYKAKIKRSTLLRRWKNPNIKAILFLSDGTIIDKFNPLRNKLELKHRKENIRYFKYLEARKYV